MLAIDPNIRWRFNAVTLIMGQFAVETMMDSKKSAAVPTSVRLDKWLWAARFYKTRALAKEMINGGKVTYNGQRAKCSRNAEVGAVLKLRQGYDEREIVIEKLSEQRQGAEIAQTLYKETQASIDKRAQNAEVRRLNLHNPAPDSKPDKKQRRELLRIKSGPE